MIWEPLSTWHLLGLFSFAILTTLVTDWLAARLRRSPQPQGVLNSILASLVWALLLFAAGVIAARYIERISVPLVGYLVFGLVAFLLSLVRALLYRRAGQERQPKPPLDRRQLLGCAIHNLTYLLCATVLFFGLSWLLKRPADPWLLIPLYIGALLPDLDSQKSIPGRLLPFISRRLENWLGHLHEWHTPAAAALVALVTTPLLLLVSAPAWYLIPLGFLSHLALDLLHPQGIMLLWPLNKTRYRIFGGLVQSPGDKTECWLAGILVLVAAILLFVVDVGPLPPPRFATPTYEQALEHYYSLRGRNLVFASIEGSWQATGRRSGGRFEVINAADESFVMLDRYTGRIFTVGRGASDDFYPSHISLQRGDAARIKPVEIRLENQTLSEALPIVYQMQREPGLQHIFVSGEVVGGDLPLDSAQTRLPKIQSPKAGRYRLNYLTAAELIALADRAVETADLIIWATYIEAPTGPTVTPLPPAPEAGP